MPKVKSKKSVQKTATKAKKKVANKSSRAGRALTAERSWVPTESRFMGIMRRVGVAGGLGIGFVALIAVGMLWASGVFGRFSEDVVRNTQSFTARTMISAGFDIRKITVVGRDRTASQAITNALGPVLGSSLMHFDPHSARARVEQLGWVRSVAVSRIWPNQINVSIREREPAALWQINGSFRLIDQEGAIIREVGTLEYPNLPFIVGEEAPEMAADLMDVLGEVEVFDDRVAALMRVKGRRWTLRLNLPGEKTMDIKLPENDYQQAVRDLAVLHDAVGVLDRDFEYIDLRDPERAFFLCHGAKSKKGPPLNVLSGDFSCASQ